MDNILSKIKKFVKERKEKFIFIAVLILVSGFSFSGGLIIGGKILKRPSLVIEKELLAQLGDSLVEIQPQNQTNPKETLFVASSKGKYYYPIDCPLAKKLSEKNKIYFKNSQEAETQGYQFNENCPRE